MLNFVMRIFATLILFSFLLLPLFPILSISISVLALVGFIPMSSLLILVVMYLPLFAYSVFKKYSFKL